MTSSDEPACPSLAAIMEACKSVIGAFIRLMTRIDEAGGVSGGQQGTSASSLIKRSSAIPSRAPDDDFTVAPQNRDLVPQHQQLGILGRGGAVEQHQPSGQPSEDQMQQPQ
jgi:hypothetical protein